MRIIFIRHGESQANVERIISNRDLPHGLTEKGKAQALALAEDLADTTAVSIFTSPIPRAQETATIIGGRLGLPIATLDALREFDCGIAEGRGDAAAWQAHNAVIAAWDRELDYDRRIDGGESFNDIQTRFPPIVDSLHDQFGSGDGDVLCVTHGAVLTLMLPLVLANIDRAFIDTRGIGNCATIVVERDRDCWICTEWDGQILIGQAGS